MKRRLAVLALVAFIFLTPACDPPFEFAGAVTTVRLFPDSAALNPGDSVRFSAVATDSAGHTVNGVRFVWSSANPSVATVTPLGWAHAMNPGRVLIRAAAQSTAGTAPLSVLTDIVAVQVDQGQVTLVPGGTLQFTASGRDAAGDTLHGRPITWRIGDTTVAQVSATGFVTALDSGDTYLGVTFGGVPTTVAISVRPVNFYAIVAASEADHTCGLANGAKVFCWGSSNLGQVGVPAVAGSLAPITAANGPAFNDVAVGATFTCALGSSRAYCWGSSARGRLGAGSQQYSTSTPVEVPGTYSVSVLAAGWAHACGLLFGTALCWGENPAAGSDSGTINWTPMPVASDSPFVLITAGVGFTCALTPSGRPYCWGINDSGQLGTGDQTETPTPLPVAGGLSLMAITAGGSHACALDSAGVAYCWGANRKGQLGTGDTTASLTPIPVSGGLTFTSIAAGGNHSCAVTPSGQVYCWGDGSLGPAPVGGGLSFGSISVGNAHACGFTTHGVYCWGKNNAGQLGDGTTTDRSTPVRVLGQP